MSSSVPGRRTILLLLVLLEGCRSWHQIEVPGPEALPAQIQVWRGDSSMSLIASTSGDGVIRGKIRDGKLISIPVVAIDSVREQSFSVGKTFLAAVGIFSAMVVIIALGSPTNN